MIDTWILKRVYTITIPLYDNNGVSLTSEIDTIRDSILSIAGGYTSTSPQRGAWLDNGTVYIDESFDIIVSVPYDKQDELERHFSWYCTLLRQHALYVTYQDKYIAEVA